RIGSESGGDLFVREQDTRHAFQVTSGFQVPGAVHGDLVGLTTVGEFLGDALVFAFGVERECRVAVHLLDQILHVLGDVDGGAVFSEKAVGASRRGGVGGASRTCRTQWR